MPSARELLERADALMRRNRKRGKHKHGDVPTLTDALDVDRGATLAPTIILPESALADADPISLDTLGDVPVLTDVVDDLRGAVGDRRGVVDESNGAVEDPSRAVDLAKPDSSTLPTAAAAAPADAPDSEPLTVPAAIGAAQSLASPAPLPDEEFILEIPPPPEDEQLGRARADVPAMLSTSEPAPSLAPGSGEWDALAEELRMQVLQRLDLFTDTGLREQLGERVKPIVDRASAELIETINHELGALVRGYVAEAIEREIESWRKRNE